MEKHRPGIRPLFLSQKMAQNDPEKKMPSTAAKATMRSAKGASAPIHLRKGGMVRLRPILGSIEGVPKNHAIRACGITHQAQAGRKRPVWVECASNAECNVQWLCYEGLGPLHGPFGLLHHGGDGVDGGEEALLLNVVAHVRVDEERVHLRVDVLHGD